ncbi:MAG: FG-GAP repeat protein [Gammaproteobacteria bacterium]|nr:FG-GAP repeat protein [Gammaproteobacteria bacterium]
MNQVARLTASDAASGANLGIAVDIDGETIVAGASGVEGTARFTGAAYVFTRPAGGWVDGNETAILTASDAAEADRLGTSIAISADIIVAATGNTPKAYVYRADGGAWTDATEDVILASDHSGVTSMHVAIEEETIVAGAPHALVAGNLQQGAAYVYQTCMSLQEPLTIAVNTGPCSVCPACPRRRVPWNRPSATISIRLATRRDGRCTGSIPPRTITS